MRFSVFWYPALKLIRCKDSGLGFGAEFRSECLLDLENRLLHLVIRHDGQVYVAKQSAPMTALDFPQSEAARRMPGSSFSTGKPSTILYVDNRAAEPVHAPWTTDDGVLIGTIAP